MVGENSYFDSSDDLLKRLAELSDDMKEVQVFVPHGLFIKNVFVKNACCLMLATNQTVVIHYEELEALLNQGVLARMKIPIRLIPVDEHSNPLEG